MIFETELGRSFELVASVTPDVNGDPWPGLQVTATVEDGTVMPTMNVTILGDVVEGRAVVMNAEGRGMLTTPTVTRIVEP